MPGVEPQVLSNPGIYQAGRRKSAKEAQPLGELAGRVADLRVCRVGRREHGFGHDARKLGRRHHLLHPPVHARTSFAVLIELGIRLHEVRVEWRLRVRGLDDRDPDAPGA